MNERLKELARQANAWYPKGYPSGEGGDEAWTNLVIFEKEDLEKFAQLLVNECAYSIQTFVDQRIPASEYPSRLKHNFGA